MLSRHKMWVPVLQHNPQFVHYFGRFVEANPVTSRNIAALDIRPEAMYVARLPGSSSSSSGGRGGAQGEVAAMLAVAVHIPPAACDDVASGLADFAGIKNNNNNNTCGAAAAAAAAAAADQRFMSRGLLTAMVDSMNSFHVMERLLPVYVAHVSVNMQSQVLDPAALAEGADIVIVSTVEKMGKRIVYCSTDLYIDSAGDAAEGEGEEEGEGGLVGLDTPATLAEMKHSLMARYRRAAHGTHVKCVLDK